jgi:hypothetical protein
MTEPFVLRERANRLRADACGLFIRPLFREADGKQGKNATLSRVKSRLKTPRTVFQPGVRGGMENSSKNAWHP